MASALTNRVGLGHFTFACVWFSSVSLNCSCFEQFEFKFSPPAVSARRDKSHSELNHVQGVIVFSSCRVNHPKKTAQKHQRGFVVV